MADNSVANGAATGAATGAAVGGPYGAVIGGAGGVLSGLLANGNDLPTVDIGALLSTIGGAGQYQQQIINQLPVNIQKQLQEYAAQNAQAGQAYQGNIATQGNNYLQSVAGLYGPNSDAANAEKDANKAAIYSTVPGTQDAVRNAMAATGGLARGNAGVALAQPYMDAASKYAQSAMGTDAAQAKAGQNATQQAMQTVNTMNDTMFQNLFGMSKQQASTILTTGNAALTTQLADLINQSNNQTNQTLSVQGLAANNGYQNAVERNAQQNAIWSGLVNGGLQGAGIEGQGGQVDIKAILAGLGAGSTGLPTGADVGSSNYMANASNTAKSLGAY